jgi:nucleotide-binding universal stress UspA family protein
VTGSGVTVALSGGDPDLRLADIGAKVAAASGSGVYLVTCRHVTTPPNAMYIDSAWVDTEAIEKEAVRVREEALSELHRLSARVRSEFPALDVTSDVLDGDEHHLLVDVSNRSDLMVLGSTQATLGKALLSRSTAHSIAHHSRCPAMLIPPGSFNGTPARVVVGVDGSPAAEAATDWAADTAQMWNVPLQIVHGWVYPYPGRRTGVNEPRGLMQLDADEVVLAAMHRARHRQPQLTLDYLVVEQHPVAALAGASPHDLVVVGARGGGLLRSALLGSTSAALIAECQGPLAIVHAVAS